MKRKYKVLTSIYSPKKEKSIDEFFYVIACNKMQAVKMVKESIGYERIEGGYHKRTIGYDNYLEGSVWLYEEPTFLENKDE